MSEIYRTLISADALAEREAAARADRNAAGEEDEPYLPMEYAVPASAASIPLEPTPVATLPPPRRTRNSSFFD